jgi:hypothetical protein
MTPKVWGPPIWIFLHAFSVNISEEGYARVGGQFFSFLTRICRMLPCPDCADHATKFISSVKVQSLKTKYDMANMLCNFHNSVNQRKKLPFFHNLRLSGYEKVNILSAFNNFVTAFTLPSQRLMNESLHRKMLASQMMKFMSSVLVYFVKPLPAAISPQLLPASPATEPTTTVSLTPKSVAPSPATEPTTHASTLTPSAIITEFDLEYEEHEDKGKEKEKENFTTVAMSHENITIEILVDDCFQEDEDEGVEVLMYL